MTPLIRKFPIYFFFIRTGCLGTLKKLTFKFKFLIKNKMYFIIKN